MIKEKTIDNNTKFGEVKLNIKKVMDEKRITIGKMSRLSRIKYDVVSNYYNNRIHIYNADILAKLCYVLDVDISELIIYVN